jgi:putative DNA primase/helicase
MLNIALSYIRRGWNPIPIPYRSKNPGVDGWQKRRITEETAAQFFSGGPQNIGVQLGQASGGLTDIDLDCAEAIRVAPYILPPTGAIFGRASKRNSHYLYKTTLASTRPQAAMRYTDPRAKVSGLGPVLVELRLGGGDTGAQTVFPGSVHKIGEPIKWEDTLDGEPAAVADLMPKVALVAACALLARYWPKGERHDAALAVGGLLARCGYNAATAKIYLEAIAKAAHDEEVADRRKAAEDSVAAVLAGKNAYGFPKMAEIFGRDVASKVANWFGYQGDVDIQPPNTAGAVFEGFEGPSERRILPTSTPGPAIIAPQWVDPKLLPSTLLPVEPFNYSFLPAALAAWVEDIADRMQCPPDFVGIPAISVLGAIVGCKIGIRPQRRTDWVEVPNFWAAIIGRPGLLKSPAIAEALKPLHRLEADAREDNDLQMKGYEIALANHKVKVEAAKREAAKAAGKGQDFHLPDFPEPEKPKLRRYLVTDATYESIGEIAADNPFGFLVHRDEIIALLKTLDREEYIAARGFFLTSWNGTHSYVFDRIGRGHIRIENACLSLLGSTQPARIAEYVRRALSGEGDDGLLQRFSLMVWPDHSADWKRADRYPDSEARAAAWFAFEMADKMSAEAAGARKDDFQKIPYLRFNDEAQEAFDSWHETLEKRVRSGEMHPALESHLAKYRTLVPAFALVSALADGVTGAVDLPALERAFRIARYLESHARRIYASGKEAETSTAKAILAKVRAGTLKDGFTCRDIHQRDWSNLSDPNQVQAGLNLLVDCDYLADQWAKRPGRPKVTYLVNPRVRPAAEAAE